MPIKRITEGLSAADGLPRLATLRKGAPKTEGKLRDLDYFRPHWDEKFLRFAPIFKDLYGEKPKEFVNVYLAAPTASESFEYWMEEHTETTVLHRCDGEEQHLWYNPDAGIYMRAKVKCLQVAHEECIEQKHLDCPGGCACKPSGRLKVILPEFWEQTGVLGYFEFITGSWYDITTIIKHLAWVEQKLIEFDLGTLDGIPFVIGREPKQISRPMENGKRAKMKKNLLYIRVNEDFGKYRFLPALKAQAVALQDGGGQPLLPETVEDGVDEDEGENTTRKFTQQRPRRINTKEKAWTETKRWGEFREWAILEFDLNDTKIFEALSSVQDHPVEKPSEFTGDQKTAAAVIIAYAYGYVTEAILNYGNEKGIATDTLQLAMDIAKQNNASEEEPSEGDFEDAEEVAE